MYHVKLLVPLRFTRNKVRWAGVMAARVFEGSRKTAAQPDGGSHWAIPAAEGEYERLVKEYENVSISVVRLIDQFDTDEAARSCSLSHVLRPLTAPATSARSSRRAAAFRPEDTGALLHHSCICKLNREAQLPVSSP